MTQTLSASSHNPTSRHTYAGLAGYSVAGLLLLMAGILFLGRWDVEGIRHLRDCVGYGHFSLAYLFTWKVIRRQLGSLSASVAYLALFLAMVAAYVAAQRWLLPAGTDDLLIMLIFMVHHASNEVLFRRQSSNGYQSFSWNGRRVLWVGLVVWLVLVDRIATVVHPWRAAGPALCGLWLAGWAIYGWRYVLRSPGASWSIAAWSVIGAVITWRLARPFESPVFAWEVPFDWLVIYHYVIWYVFYTRKLLTRQGRWVVPGMRWDSPASAWKTATTIPGGFLLLIAAGNLAIVSLYAATLPAVNVLAAGTGLDFFHINTMAHVLFGVGVPTRTAAVRATPPRSAEAVPQFA